MRLLLDTNALLWALTNGPRIAPVRDLLLDDENEIFVSTVSWWEIAIKTRIGKLDANPETSHHRAGKRIFWIAASRLPCGDAGYNAQAPQ